jgi:DNA-binding LytR/AlgR family response regulator
MRRLIIDDEAASRSQLRRMLSKHTDIEIVGEAEDGMAGLELIASTPADLMLLDIEMPIINGIQILKSISADVSVPIAVFVIGYDEHALAAYEADALAYLLKPVEEDRLLSTLDRARRLISEPLEHVAEQRRFAEIITKRSVRIEQVVEKKVRFYLLRPSEILHFSAADGLVKAHTSKEVYLINLTFNELEESLEPLRFFRAPRAALVNLNQIKEIQPSFRSSYVLLLADSANTEVQVSERRAKILRECIPGL